MCASGGRRSGAPPPTLTQQRMDLWHMATTLDLRIKEFADRGPQALDSCTTTCLEGLLRQLAAAREYHLTHDAEAANRGLGFKAPGDSVAQGWLQEDARAHSQALYRQGLRNRGRGSGGAAASSSVGTGSTGGGGASAAGGKGSGRGRAAPPAPAH